MNTHRSTPPAREPALTVGSISALVSAVLALVVVFGVELPPGLEAALLAVIAAAAPIVAGFITRARVTPNDKVVEQRDGDLVIAGEGHDTIHVGDAIRDLHDG